MHFFLIALILIVAAQGYFILAKRFNIIDRPNERSSHTKPTIRGGGILFVVSTLLFFFFSEFQYPYFVLGLLLVALISFVDDLYTLGSKIRLAVQFIAISLVFFQLGIFAEPLWMVPPLLVFCVGLLNIYNFMDGINGITGLCSMATIIGFLMLNGEAELVPSSLLLYTLMALAIFGFYNFRKKALFFAGDVGSISIAVIIIFLGLHFGLALRAPIVILLVGVYLVDGTMTIGSRLRKRENIFKPHRSHLYQRLVQRTGLSHLQVSMAYAGLQFLLALLVFLMYQMPMQQQFLALFGTILLLGLLHFVLILKLNRQEYPENLSANSGQAPRAYGGKPE
ncbi:MAG: glycosyltransferase family 4 protein [Sediminicola sp.]